MKGNGEDNRLPIICMTMKYRFTYEENAPNKVLAGQVTEDKCFRNDALARKDGWKTLRLRDCLYVLIERLVKDRYQPVAKYNRLQFQ